MTDYMTTQRAATDAIQALGPLYAAEFATLTGTPWHYVDPRTPGDDDTYRWSHSFNLVRTDTGLALSLYVDLSRKRAGASPALPPMPNGGPHGNNTTWRNWNFTGPDGDRREKPEAGVSYDRFIAAVPACAKRFVTMVYVPYAEVWPLVAFRTGEKAAGYAEMERITQLLMSEFDGRLPTHNRSDETRTVYFATGLPSVTVSFGGHLRVEHPPFTLDTFRAYARATLAINGVIQ